MSRLNARQTAVFAAIAAFAVTGAVLVTSAEDAKATGLPTTHRDTGAYIMWSGTTPRAYAHHRTA